MAALKRQAADREMSFDESEIKKKMDEIAKWLDQQPSPPAGSRLKPVQTPTVPEVKVPEVTAPEVSAPAFADDGGHTLESIAANRLALRRQREAEDRTGLRSVLERFPGPIATPRGPLSSAVAEIMERQRELDTLPERRPTPREILEPLREEMPRTEARRDEPRSEKHDPSAQMEATFERFVSRFEARAEQTFQTLESSLADVRRLLDEAKTPVEAAEAAAAYIVQTRLHDLETGTNAKIEEVARGLADLRAETAESERRTRDLLDAVRATLEHVATRLPERHGRRPVAPQANIPEPNLTLRVREAARQAMEESAEEEPLKLGPRVSGSTPERRRFIAAARRSTSEGERPEPTVKYRTVGGRAPRDPLPETKVSAKPKHGAVRRVLLAGTAAAVLVIGIYAGSSQILDSLLTSQEVALATTPAEQTPAAAPAKPARQASRATSSLLSAEPVGGGSSFTPKEPVITGSITPALPTLPDALGSEKLRQLATSGDAAAQYEVAMRLAEGTGVPRDQALAAQWFQLAADRGLVPAQYRLASLTEKGLGVAKDIARARDLYAKAAEAGNVQAMHNLGVIYAEGGLGQPDLAAALDWFRKAADYGVKDSQYNLGIFYAKGLSTAQDFGQSYLWFALAAAQGDKDAAAKRDQIASKIDADRLTALRISADTWKPKTAIAAANTVAAPADGWDGPASGRAATGAAPQAQ